MLEPFQPDKMPVVMVHGLWSSPVTWMEMYNDLRSDPAVRDHYQFWFYLYPSGQPFWFSGTQMRESLAMMRRELDPERRYPALDQMVLVGHSMGGLVSKMQSVESGDAFWHTTSDHPFADLKADPAVRRSLANSYFFDPSPSVRTVITIGTPHRGSQFANDTTRWLGHKLITLPGKMLTGREQLLTLNPDFFRPNSPIEITTSIDSLGARFATATAVAGGRTRSVDHLPQHRGPRARLRLATLFYRRRRWRGLAHQRSPRSNATSSIANRRAGRSRQSPPPSGKHSRSAANSARTIGRPAGVS